MRVLLKMPLDFDSLLSIVSKANYKSTRLTVIRLISVKKRDMNLSNGCEVVSKKHFLFLLLIRPSFFVVDYFSLLF